MSDISVSDARARLADVVERARVEREPVFLTRRGRRVAAVIDAEILSRLIDDAEELADLRAATDARVEIGHHDPILWSEVKADLGITDDAASA